MRIVWETFGWMAIGAFLALFAFAVYVALTSRRD